jgi:hypothetical protein
MKLRRVLRRLLISFCAIVAAYFLIYAVLSLNGSYQVVYSDLRHADYGWVPYGFYPPKHQQPNWVNTALFRIYLPIFELDETYIHKNPPPSIYFTTPEIKK